MDTTFIWKYTRELLRFLAASLVKGKVWARIQFLDRWKHHIPATKSNPNTMIARITLDIKLENFSRFW